MIKKEMIAMLLAGGQGSRLGVLTDQIAKPAVAFGGKYRIIDFPLSNCINSGIDTVGVLTQYQPMRLNTHIGIGIPWDLDKNVGGVHVLSPYESNYGNGWYMGTADAVYQNMNFMEQYNPEYIVILSGDHIYKMDYQLMLDHHKANKADLTVACMTVPWEEASRFGIMITDEYGRITEFEEKPKEPRSNLASMGIYIFTYSVFKEAVEKLKDTPELDFGKHVLPYCLNNGNRIFAYEFSGYWKDVGTLDSYWQANMELIELVPEFNLYEEFWQIYTNIDTMRPAYIGADTKIDRSIVSEGSELYGNVYASVLGYGVEIGKGSTVSNSVIMSNVKIGRNCHIEKAIIADDVVIGDNVRIGEGEEVPNEVRADIYKDGLATIGERTVIPDNTVIGKNTAVYGVTTPEDYSDGCLPSGGYLVKEGN